MVGVAGFEPAVSCSQNRRFTRLSYTPILVNTYMKCTSCEIVAAKNAAVKKSYARPKDEPIATSSRSRPQTQSQKVQTDQAEQDS